MLTANPNEAPPTEPYTRRDNIMDESVQDVDPPGRLPSVYEVFQFLFLVLSPLFLAKKLCSYLFRLSWKPLFRENQKTAFRLDRVENFVTHLRRGQAVVAAQLNKRNENAQDVEDAARKNARQDFKTLKADVKRLNKELEVRMVTQITNTFEAQDNKFEVIREELVSDQELAVEELNERIGTLEARERLNASRIESEKQVTASLKDRDTQISSIGAHARKATKDIVELKKKISEMTSTVGEIQSAKELLEITHKNLKEDAAEELERKNAELVTLREEFTKFKQEREAEKKAEQEGLRSEKEKVETHATHEDLTALRDQMIAISKKLEAKADKTYAEETAVLETQVEELQSSHDAVLDKIDELEKNLEAHDAEITQLKVDRDKYLRRTSEIEVTTTSLKVTTDKLTKDGEESRDKAADFETKLVELEDSLEELRSSREKETQEASTIADTEKALSDEVSKLQSDHKEFLAQIEEVKKTTTILAESFKNLEYRTDRHPIVEESTQTTSSGASDDKISAFQREQVARLDKLEEDRSNDSARIDILDASVNKQVTVNETLKGTVSDIETKTDSIKTDLDAIRDQVQAKADSTTVTQRIADFENDLKGLTENGLEGIRTQFRKNSEEVKESFTHVNGKIWGLETGFQDVRSLIKAKADTKSVDTAITKLEDEIAKFSSSEKGVENIPSLTQSQAITETVENTSGPEANIEGLRKEIGDIGSQVREQGEKITKNEAAVSAVVPRVERLERANKANESMIEKSSLMESRIADTENKVNNLKESLDGFDATLQDFELGKKEDLVLITNLQNFIFGINHGLTAKSENDAAEFARIADAIKKLNASKDATNSSMLLLQNGGQEFAGFRKTTEEIIKEIKASLNKITIRQNNQDAQASQARSASENTNPSGQQLEFRKKILNDITESFEKKFEQYKEARKREIKQAINDTVNSKVNVIERQLLGTIHDIIKSIESGETRDQIVHPDEQEQATKKPSSALAPLDTSGEQHMNQSIQVPDQAETSVAETRKPTPVTQDHQDEFSPLIVSSEQNFEQEKDQSTQNPKPVETSFAKTPEGKFNWAEEYDNIYPTTPQSSTSTKIPALKTSPTDFKPRQTPVTPDNSKSFIPVKTPMVSKSTETPGTQDSSRDVQATEAQEKPWNRLGDTKPNFNTMMAASKWAPQPGAPGSPQATGQSDSENSGGNQGWKQGRNRGGNQGGNQRGNRGGYGGGNGGGGKYRGGGSGNRGGRGEGNRKY